MPRPATRPATGRTPRRRGKKADAWMTDPAATAEQAGLTYTNDHGPGITRRPFRKGFRYTLPDGTPCTEPQTLKRIASLVLPPAWTHVWICPLPEGHLQATGLDAKGRKQYRYHPGWNAIRSETKFHRLPQFIAHLPAIRRRVNEDLAVAGLPYRKVLALIVRVMEQTHIRIGNDEYRKLYGTFGLTTLRDKHVRISGTETVFHFKGKKGVEHRVSLRSRRLTRLIGQCRDLPGQELFQYLDDTGQRRSIGSSDVNQYLKEITQDTFTAKDFRTWAATLHAFRECCAAAPFGTATEARRNVQQIVDAVASKLGNTRTVCKKYYIHPHILDSYETGMLKAPPPDEPDEMAENGDLSPTERLVRDIILKAAPQAGSRV